MTELKNKIIQQLRFHRISGMTEDSALKEYVDAYNRTTPDVTP